MQKRSTREQINSVEDVGMHRGWDNSMESCMFLSRIYCCSAECGRGHDWDRRFRHVCAMEHENERRKQVGHKVEKQYLLKELWFREA